MRKVFKVFKKDLKNIIRNPVALIIVIGLSILPSLYAWINIKACWDPYANTGNLPVAVINEDEGAVFNGKNINVGDQIIEQLKKNKSINWIFVDEWQGNYGLNEGKYYALIDIPSNFSKGLISLSTATPKKPDIIYRNNEKLNAIAAKITNVAKDELAKNIKTNFISTVNKEALTLLDTIGGNLKVNKAQIIELKDTVNEASDNISSTEKFIKEANTNSASLQKYLTDVQTNLPKITEQINSLQQATQASKSLVLSTKQTISTTMNTLNNDMVEIQTTTRQIDVQLSKLKDINNSTNTDNLSDYTNQLINLNDSLNKTTTADIKNLEAINRSNPNNAITNLINLLKTLNGLIADENQSLRQLNTMVSSKAEKDTINSAIDKLSSLNNEISNDMVVTSNTFYSTALPVLDSICNVLTTNLDNIDSVLEATKVIVPQLNALANYGISSSKLSIEQANDLANKLTELQSQLTTLSDKMNSLSDENLDQIIKIMKMNPDEIAGFIASPLNVKEVDIYNAGLFGIGLTPFYTVLAIWVGALLLSSLLTTECENTIDGEPLNLIQRHFGKMLLFLMISFIQSIIVTLGDKYILGVNPENLPLMLGFAIVSGITFTIIIFTLVSVLGNVGKAIAVVIMVFQIAGAGGIYPIETNPRIFGILQPLWPFTYAITGFREAIAGPVWNTVYKNLLSLLVFAIVFLILAILKKPFHRLTESMEHNFKKSGL